MPRISILRMRESSLAMNAQIFLGGVERVGQLIRSFRAITSSATALSGQSWPKA
jgi:hypothetical protein